MSFAFTLVLVALALVPLLAVGYLVGQRTRRRQAAAFANPALLPNLVPRRVGWRRHLVPALGLLALVISRSETAPGVRLLRLEPRT